MDFPSTGIIILTSILFDYYCNILFIKYTHIYIYMYLLLVGCVVVLFGKHKCDYELNKNKYY